MATNITTDRFEKTYRCSCSYGSKDAEKYDVRLDPGTYKVELWGPSGGCATSTTGRGAYAFAYIRVSLPTTYYLFVGAQGTCSSEEKQIGGCNGGGDSYIGTQDKSKTGSGGGSTDLRTGLYPTTRILIAAGGGGKGHNYGYGGNAGSLIGFNGTGWTNTTFGKGGTQESGGIGGNYYNAKALNGSLLYGSSGIGYGYSAGGGGGGYYGGGGAYESGAGGGSSYISPSLSGFTKGGNELFHLPASKGYERGHLGDGVAVITLVGGKKCRTVNGSPRFLYCILLFCITVCS